MPYQRSIAVNCFRGFSEFGEEAGNGVRAGRARLCCRGAGSLLSEGGTLNLIEGASIIDECSTSFKPSGRRASGETAGES